MKQIVKYIMTRTYKPLLVKYLAKERAYRYRGIVLQVPPEVFHPGFFFSTKLLLNYISKQPLNNRNFLELGAGSGLISFYVAKQGACVTATDINSVAIDYLKKNALVNDLEIEIVLSDMFATVTKCRYDIVAINPPYYKREPLSHLDHAWYCGEEGEYFKKLFSGLDEYIHSSSEVLMVLCDGSDIEMIKNIAAGEGFGMECVHCKSNLVETNFIYSIKEVG